MTRFKAPWCRSLVTSSTALVVLMACLSVLVAWQLPVSPEDTPADAMTRLAAISAPLVMLPLFALFAVRGYRVQAGSLVIERLLWRHRVALAGLRGARADPAFLDNSIPLVANGGAFVFAGLMRHAQAGRFRCWVNDPARAVVLRFADRVVVVSPDDPAAFISALPRLASRPPGEARRPAPPGGGQARKEHDSR